MKQTFFQYLRLTESEMKAMWEGCLFTFDANVLLNVYGYSQGTRDELLALLERLGPRVRVCHQFGLESARNRVKVIVKQVNNYLRAEKAFEDIQTQHFAPRHEHPFLLPKSLEAFDALRRELADNRKQMESLISRDAYADRVCEIFKDKVGKAPSESELQQLHQEAKSRYDKAIPPGYADLKEKGEPDAFADYIGWCQIIEIAKAEEKPVIHITDDTKEDWWYIERERTVGPRPELIAEFQRDAQQMFFMYSSYSFLKAASKYLDQRIQQSAIDEVSAMIASLKKEVSELKAATAAIKPLTQDALSNTTAPTAPKPTDMPKSEQPKVSDPGPSDPGDAKPST